MLLETLSKLKEWRNDIMLTNTDIRARAAEKNVRLWQIAEELNINDGNFSRKLRKELSDIEKKRIFIIIDETVQSTFTVI